MSVAPPAGVFSVECRHCERLMLAQPGWVGREVECPFCHNVQTVPAPALPPAPSPRAAPPNLAPGRVFNFPCPRCDCLLEAHTGMSRQMAACPTCAARLLIPDVHPRTGLPFTAELVESPVDDPTPLHAYAASGQQAPTIARGPDGQPYIVCPGCRTASAMDADRCASCGTPFTLAAAPTSRSSRDRTAATAAVTFGVLGLLLFITVLPSLLAVLFGLRGLAAGASRSGAGALVGLLLGGLGAAGGVAFWIIVLR